MTWPVGMPTNTLIANHLMMPDGETPLTGAIHLRCSVPRLVYTDPGGEHTSIFRRPIVIPVVNGVVVASDPIPHLNHPNVSPTPAYWIVQEFANGAPAAAPWQLTPTADDAVIDLDSRAPIAGDPGIPVAIGPPGPSTVSEDAGNAATLGTDDLIFVPGLGADENYVTDAELAALHTHPAGAATLQQVASLVKTDFLAGSGSDLPWAKAALASGTVSFAALAARHPGISSASSSTSANSGYRWYMDPTFRAPDLARMTLVFMMDTSISATGVIRYGAMSSATATTTQVRQIAAQIEGAVLKGVTSNESSSSATATTYTLAPATWYRLVIETNATATLVTFTLYSESDVVLWTDTIATNIPGPTALYVYHALVAYNTGTAVAVLGHFDYMGVVVSNSATRW